MRRRFERLSDDELEASIHDFTKALSDCNLKVTDVSIRVSWRLSLHRLQQERTHRMPKRRDEHLTEVELRIVIDDLEECIQKYNQAAEGLEVGADWVTRLGQLKHELHLRRGFGV